MQGMQFLCVSMSGLGGVKMNDVEAGNSFTGVHVEDL